jgi:pimeloyl-ACP methyl ester carboxylesterase
MPTALVNGVSLHYEVTGAGFPLVWSHEFAGACESWEAQVRFFSRRYQVITYNARGYPPSGVPADPEAYSQERSVEDLHGLLGHLGIQHAHIGGLSMGGNVALNFGLAHPQMARSLVVAATGSGTTDRARFQREGEEVARRLESEGMEAMAQVYASGPTRVQFRRKDPRGWEEFTRALAGHSATGMANTFRGVILRRPTIFALGDRLRALEVPTLIMTGDEDEPCIEPAVFMKRHIPRSGLVVFPQSGHTINLEEPDLFNRTVLDFLTAVEAGRWARRDAVSEAGTLLPR